MSTPTRPVPDEQSRAFNLAVCERLGLDPNIISEDDFRAAIRVVGGEELGEVEVSFKAYLPAGELLRMFNEAGRR